MRIGVIDSGIGGLTVLRRLISDCPEHEYIYYGDTIHMPYGDKTKEELIKYGNNIIKFLESKNVDIILLACGTLSSNKEYLISNKKVIDLLTPLNNKLDKYNKVSIIATPLSIKTNAYVKYIHTNTNLISAPLLVPIIESNNYDKLNDCLNDYLSTTIDSDALLLGCTHYPIVINEIKKIFKKDIICFEDYIVPIIKDLKKTKYSLKVYFSYINENIIKNVHTLLNNDIEIERVSLND